MESTRPKTPNQHITLADGRQLGFAEFGDLQGKAVFYFHGFPGSRLEARLADRISDESHVRFIGIDRPGYGLSSVKAARTFMDWADDVAELADSLGIDCFSILGVSGGGPYAAACACKIFYRLDAVGIVCGMGPVDVPGLMRDMPWRTSMWLSICGMENRTGSYRRKWVAIWPSLYRIAAPPITRERATFRSS